MIVIEKKTFQSQLWSPLTAKLFKLSTKKAIS